MSFESYTTGDQDFSSQLTRIVQASPKVLFLPNYYSEVPLQIQQARRLGFTGDFLGSDGWGSPEIIKLGGSDMEGQFFSTHYAPDIATPTAQKFIKAYEERYKELPDDVAALTYDSFGMPVSYTHLMIPMDKAQTALMWAQDKHGSSAEVLVVVNSHRLLSLIHI